MTTITRTDDLEILLAVVDSGGFSMAAELLNLQVAKVSRAVSRLEKQLDTTLLTRTTRRVELTEEGRQFVDKVRQVLALLTTAEEEIKLGQQLPSGKLRIDMPTSFMLHQLLPHIADFRHIYPKIELQLSANDDVIDLLEKRTDVAIRIGKLDDSTLHSRLLGHARLYLVATPQYIQRFGQPNTAEDLAHHQCIGYFNHAKLNVWPVGAGTPITPCISASNGEIIRQLCLAHNGIACLSHFTIKDDLLSGALVSILQPQMQSPHPREIVNAVYYKNSALSSRIQVFLDFIQSRLTF